MEEGAVAGWGRAGARCAREVASLRMLACGRARDEGAGRGALLCRIFRYRTDRKGGPFSVYTKNGRPLQTSGDKVYSGSGTVVGRIRGSKVFGPDGRYVGTIVNDRLVYRSTDSAGIGSPFAAANRAGTARAGHVGSTILGEEPNIPD